MHNEENAYRINVWDIVIRMVANAWDTVHYFRLYFGSMDSLHKIVTELQWITNLPMDAKREDIILCLSNCMDNKDVKKQLYTLTVNVPYRFLSPWINYTSDNDVIVRSHTYENGCLYSIQKDFDRNPCDLSYAAAHWLRLIYFTPATNWHSDIFYLHLKQTKDVL